MRIYRRPGLAKFLQEMSQIFEIVIFTAANQEYADAVLDSLNDCKFYIAHRLYWDHITISDNVSEGGLSATQEISYFKDLSKIGRDLSKTIIVDNIAENFSLQEGNGIQILEWKGENPNDQALYRMSELLKQIVNIAPAMGNDLTKALAKFNNYVQ
jgi:CTD small phosphatase-like protein 2